MTGIVGKLTIKSTFVFVKDAIAIVIIVDRVHRAIAIGVRARQLTMPGACRNGRRFNLPYFGFEVPITLEALMAGRVVRCRNVSAGYRTEQHGRFQPVRSAGEIATINEDIPIGVQRLGDDRQFIKMLALHAVGIQDGIAQKQAALIAM